MADITVKDLANLMKTDDSKLLKLLNDAGMDKKNATDMISDEEKNALLAHIQSSKSNTVVVKRKSTQQIKVDGNRKINIEVRKKRKIVLPTVEEPKVESPQAPVIDTVKPEPIIEVKAAEVQSAPQTEVAVEAQQNTAEAKKETKPAVKRPTDLQKKALIEVADDANIDEVLEIVKPKTAKVDKPKESSFRITERPTAPVEPVAAKEKEAPKRTFNNAPKSRKEDDDDKGRGKAVKKEKGFKKANAKTVYQLNDDFDDGFGGGRKGGKRGGKKVKTQEFTKPVEPVSKQVVIYEGITVNELAQKMAIKAAEVIKVLFKMGVMATINQALDQDTAILIVEEMGHKYSLHKEEVIEETVAIDHGDAEMITRAPVVTIMGHVDHGKTSLLDYIRKTKVVSGEAGGITQHIGAYSVKTSKGQITFLDTPGHEAFTAMRARGASSTDIVILVVAADDGVMPQTVEAIQHAKAAGVPIIVAVNKMDKPSADPDRVKHELSSHDVIPEDWGGDVMFAHVSAHTGAGVEDLLDGILLQSEVLELKAVKDGFAKGVVIESRLEKGRGAVATILVQSGLLKQGDIVLCGTEYGRVRSMSNCTGQQIKSAGPSTPVEILGLSGVPNAGDEMIAVKDDKTAREVAEHRLQKLKEARLKQQQASKLSSLFDRMGEAAGEQQTLNVIIKADVQGSVEAIRESLIKLSTDDVKVDVIASGIGGITSSDISLAVASGAVVFGFNVRADGAARKQAEAEAIELRYYSIIYDLMDDVKQAMSGMLSPELREQIIGIAQVRDVFKSSKFGAIAGCMVIEGVIKRNNPIRVLRDQVVIYEGSLESLKRFKDDANEVKKGMECGIGVKNYNDIKAGDQIEVFEMVEFKREI